MSTHLEEYLAYYRDLEAPKYAVLVTGEWGTGKTYQVKKCIPEDGRYYISLFGVQTVEELHAEVLAIASPRFSKLNERLETVSDIGASVPFPFSLAGTAPNIVNAILKRDLEPNKILIFDDLERSNINQKDLLGAINSYVERGFRVIVIVHDKKMSKKFHGKKEKIFGQTVRVQPQIREAMDSFLSDVDEPKDKQFLATHRAAILDIFKSSEEKSLRILRHVVEDIQRLTKCLTDTHLNNVDAMHELVQLFSAFDIETRVARIGKEALNNRNYVSSEYYVREQINQDEEMPKPSLMEADERYATIDMEGNLLSDKVLVAMFIDGRYPKDEIRRSLDNSAHFIKPAEVAPWKIVISFDSLDDKTVKGGRIRMEKQFSDRSVTNSGEMLHIFALKIMMAENDIDDKAIEIVAVECKTYIDDLLKSGNLPPRELDWRWRDEFSGSYDGQAYWVSDIAKPHFKKLLDYLISTREKAFENQFPKILADFLTMIGSDSRQFYEAVSQSHADVENNNPYELIPILHQMPAEEFVDKWLGSPVGNWRYTALALDSRYSYGRIDNDLSAEKDWAVEVRKLLEKHADAAEGFRALRIRRMISKELKALLAKK